MQKKLLFFFWTLVMAINATGQDKPDELADKVIVAFQTKNFDNYRRLLIDTADYKELLNDFIKNNNIPEAQKTEILEKAKLRMESGDTVFRKDFTRLIKKGEKLGINWSEISKADFIYNSSNTVNSDKKTLTGHLNFVFKNTTFVLFGIEATELRSGLKITEIRTVLKGGVGQYVNPDLLDDEDL